MTAKLTFFQINFNLNSEFTLDRFLIHSHLNNHFCCVLGTTYANESFPSTILDSPCLDTFCSMQDVSAIADGYEHYPDKEMNGIIFEVAHHTVKSLVKLSSSFSSAKEMFKELPWLFKKTGETVRNKFHCMEKHEEAGALVIRSFIKTESEREIVTGSVGDCIAIAWIPMTLELKILSHPRQYKVHGIFRPHGCLRTIIWWYDSKKY